MVSFFVSAIVAVVVLFLIFFLFFRYADIFGTSPKDVKGEKKEKKKKQKGAESESEPEPEIRQELEVKRLTLEIMNSVKRIKKIKKAGKKRTDEENEWIFNLGKRLVYGETLSIWLGPEEIFVIIFAINYAIKTGHVDETDGYKKKNWYQRQAVLWCIDLCFIKDIPDNDPVENRRYWKTYLIKYRGWGTHIPYKLIEEGKLSRGPNFKIVDRAYLLEIIKNQK